MNSRLKLAIGAIGAVALALLSACGGVDDESDSDKQLTASQKMWGYWYSSSTNVLWQFSSSAAADGKMYEGKMWQGSTDGSACRITHIDYSVNTSGTTVTYYVTRAIGTGTNNTYDSGSIHEGPYSASYSISGESATIGSGTYTRDSTTPRGC